MLFTDIEGSTNLVDSYPDLYDQMLLRHNELLRSAIHSYGGEEINVAGDSVFALFPASAQGVQAAIDAQFALTKEEWAQGCKPLVRMGLHSGKVRRYDAAITGIEVHRAARIASVAHGGQIVISNVVRDEIAEDPIGPNVEIRDLGFHRLKDLRYPEALFDLVIPGLKSDFAPLSSIGTNRTNLPSDVSVLYGRTSELARLNRIIANKQSRIVTLTGAGGVGKTSLAIHAGRSALSSFSRGVFFVQLEEIDNPDLIASEICKAVGLQEVPGISAVETVCNSLGGAEALLILDTFEHLVQGAPIINTILRRCPAVTIVATSREPLKLRSETEFVVPPLTPPDEGANVDQIRENPSVQLFENFVHRERPDYRLGNDTLALISRICRRLDGLPLALELAASHVGLLSVAELEDRLQTRMQDLPSKARDIDPRHRTLRLMIGWSDHLLTESQRGVFYASAVFNGGFDLRAVESLFEGDVEVVDQVEALLDKSLLFRTTALGRPRLNMLDTVRDFALDKLRESGDYETMRIRQADHFTELVLSAAPNVMRFNQRDFVEDLMQESGNIRMALAWRMKQSNALESVKLIEALRWFWISRGQFSEARTWSDKALKHARTTGEPEPLARILNSAALIQYMSGDPETAREYGVESYRIYSELGNKAGIAGAGIIAGIAKATAGDPEAGGMLIGESLELSRLIGDDYGTALALIAIGEGTRAEGDETAAEAHYHDALKLLDKLGDTYWPGHLLQNLAHFRLHSGDWRNAAVLAGQALAIGERYDYPMVVNLAIAAISGVLAAKGDWDGAAEIIGAVNGRLARLGVRFEPTDDADFQKIVSAVRKILGNKRFTRSTDNGARRHWDEILSSCRAAVAS
ncbi:adenylate/guanylate cyclase domain-containing protein [Sinorhizobium garamanticum]|uniref:Adenylate/guanylate cyclase domain-containing protein n=1 Tax=Sinorhizobium garamanticum TaxID=680247 RepID=A0ABY8DGN9_9HYPH|nr:adenylate/guanylate cyclase domain-containing protein [Sinorhizobium garamanticum]WEX90065.1 adenylate/guanylate cyclase domain-containing protein [Sinorhizobium garamanticum]